MKISIGSKIVQGPWGGGNLFAINLTNYLKSNGHSVTYDLSHPDIDLILLTDPRSRSESSSTFNHIEIEKYKKYVNHSITFTTPSKFKFINSNIWYPITSINNICSIFL